MQPIHWFPGHMAKARREIADQLKSVDVVLEIVDVRLPRASANPMLQDLVGKKPRVLVLTREDLADPTVTAAWLEYFRSEKQLAVVVDARTGRGIRDITRALEQAASDKRAKEASRGLKPGTIRTMVVGIPNVGKSSVINRLAGRAATKIGDRPGITKTQQWIRLEGIDLLDTPGVLWPKIEDQRAGYILAITGAIKAEILDMQLLAAYLISWFSQHYRSAMLERYGVDVQPFLWEGVESSWEKAEPILEAVAARRGFRRSGGILDVERAAELLIRETQTGKLGRLSFETPPIHLS
ncbi:ribosome biogenesis GTPase YlqF [Alicyclobacillus mengziensis]|uniref:Ribosome biogenesis GTPase A n=1 Tax=Alicyclobacillus mengziensis TaxID=2931921 RepID=A0A9X7Z9E0_9BACL|nr:ribosome biogenesis GTPase YlqF [Alicyclobacillus mengziensis]QSO49550.1 ribosome biogenesis GTPase YlqF [Alicyclobacillus mengziensis]